MQAVEATIPMRPYAATLVAVKTAHAVFYREKHKFYNRIC